MFFSYLEILGEGLAIVLLAIVFYVLQKKTKFGKLSLFKSQLIIGLAFGILSIGATEFTVPIIGSSIFANVRDACFVVPGLIFGGPSGLIAALIGGTYRGLATLWHPGFEATWIACTIASFSAAIVAAVFRRFLFDGKRPAFYFGFPIAMVTETFHMLLIFLADLNNVKASFSIVESIATPVIVGNSVTVALALLIISLLNHEFKIGRRNREHKEIAQSFAGWLSLTVIIAFVLTIAFDIVIQRGLAEYSCNEEIELNVSDVKQDINDASDNNLLKIMGYAADDAELLASNYTNEGMENILTVTLPARGYSVAEVIYIDPKGIIKASYSKEAVDLGDGSGLTHNPYLSNGGYDMTSGTQSNAFMVLLDESWLSSNPSHQLVQAYGPISYSTSIYRKFAGQTLFKANGSIDGFLQVSYASTEFHKDISSVVNGATKNRLIGETGSLIIADEAYQIKSQRKNYNYGANAILSDIGFTTDELTNTLSVRNSDGTAASAGKTYRGNIYLTDCYCRFDFVEGYYIIGVVPYSEALYTARVSVYILFFMEIILFAFIFACVYFLIKRLVVTNIRRINSSLGEITKGNLNVVVDVKSNEEFASLSNDINSTVVTLKRYIAEASARIDKELEFARSIQLSSLPSTWPAFPTRPDFSIYALMAPAKEVGGDFYDLYLLDYTHLAILVAYVSGKGIPASLFMMRAKALIKGYVMERLPLDEAFTKANSSLYENNEAELFVTAWLGVWDMKTGVLTYVNAGHNPPLVKKANGDYQYLPGKPNFVLAGIKSPKYKVNQIPFQYGDSIFLYTDGVTEATSKNSVLFGDERLLKGINAHKSLQPKELIGEIKAEVDYFQTGVPQFDDITMLSLQTAEPLGVFEGKPCKEALTKITSFVEEKLEEVLSPKTMVKIDIAVDEIASNIISYSGASNAKLELFQTAGSVILRFSDNGLPFDPSSVPDPDTSTSIEDRKIGGLGIYMTKKSMDLFAYTNDNGTNILLIKTKK